ncbi:LysR substrate-binding domain-containing protein [Dickeya oryzae]|uniref:LysR substrate-binding domain-containing protein n=1 Tax=Dickeya oryzae TaxID=1240404 RepID=UPI00039CCC23|nr:LysR substrate-binding domain-containing protein [Dickeya oryzae]
MDSLDDLYLFKQVVDFNGISSASRQLGIAKSTLSRRINALESRLGVRLFHHGPRQFQLTTFGQFCYEKCVVLAHQAEQIHIMAEQSREHPVGRLHVICPPMIGSRLIEAIATEFACMAPDVHLHLEETTGRYDPRSAQADVVIYPSFKPLADSTLVARRIFTSSYMLVACPELLADKPVVDHPQALASVNCLGLGERSGDWVWELRNEQQVFQFRFKPVFTSTQPTALLQAALHGLGVASLPTLLCQDDLQKGNLTQVLTSWRPKSVTFFAIHPGSKAMTAATRAFLDLLVTRTRHLDDDGR